MTEFRASGPQKPATVRPVAFQAQDPSNNPVVAADNENDYKIRIETPGIELWSRLDSEPVLQKRLIQEGLERGQVMPPLPTPTPVYQKFAPRAFVCRTAYTEPNFVNYNRLYYEEKNAERYGWDLGFISPFVSTIYFFKDTILFPSNFASYPFSRFETSAGQCQPGDAVPYLLYPPEVTLTGGVAEVAIVLGLLALFP